MQMRTNGVGTGRERGAHSDVSPATWGERRPARRRRRRERLRYRRTRKRRKWKQLGDEMFFKVFLRVVEFSTRIRIGTLLNLTLNAIYC